MTDPYEFSRRVRGCLDQWDVVFMCSENHTKRREAFYGAMRDFANEYDSRVARYEAEIAVLRAEVERLSQPPPEIIKAQRTRPHPNPWVDLAPLTTSGGAG